MHLKYAEMLAIVVAEKRGHMGRVFFFFCTQYSLDIVNTIPQNMDNGNFSCGVFIDLKKAFDTVNLEILIGKLENYGI